MKRQSAKNCMYPYQLVEVSTKELKKNLRPPLRDAHPKGFSQNSHILLEHVVSEVQRREEQKRTTIQFWISTSVIFAVGASQLPVAIEAFQKIFGVHL